MNDILDKVLTPEQVAQYLQINTDTVYDLIHDHKLAATRIGRTYRIPLSDIEVFMQVNSTRPQVRKALFDRVETIAKRNRGMKETKAMKELNRLDTTRKSSLTYP